jgi:hypothetical protein
VQTVYQEKKISITPLTLDSTARVEARAVQDLL